MANSEIIEILKKHRDDLRAEGVSHIGLFGSFARGTETPQSDIDLVADFEERVSLVDIVRIEGKLARLLGRRVDLVEGRAVAARARSSMTRDRINAF